MNIKELAVQADKLADQMLGEFATLTEYQTVRDQKFAELIAKECANICMENQFGGDAEYNNGSVNSAELIKKCFGVE